MMFDPFGHRMIGAASILPAPRGEWLFNAYRLLWVAGFALMFTVNLYTAPRA